MAIKQTILAVLLAATFVPAHAFLEDGEARKAILDLRQRVQTQGEDIQALRASVLDQQSEIDRIKRELANQYGAAESLTRDVQVLQQRSSDLAKGFDARLQQIEPQEISLDGKTFQAFPQETAAYDLALQDIQAQNYAAAVKSFTDFLKAYPTSGYKVSASLFLAMGYYGQKNCAAAEPLFLSVFEDRLHSYAPMAGRSLASCYLESKKTTAARDVLNALIKRYPDSQDAEAAAATLATLPAAPAPAAKKSAKTKK